MTQQSDLQSIKALLHGMPLPPNQPLPAGVTDGALAMAERRLKQTLPRQWKALLRLSNGPCVGPGGLFGIRPALEFLDSEALLESYPHWVASGWIPVAGDGCGNYFVAVPHNGLWPVVFVEMTVDPTRPAYVVASSILRFVVALLEKEAGATGWPFDERTVMASDPGMPALETAFTLPWKA